MSDEPAIVKLEDRLPELLRNRRTQRRIFTAEELEAMREHELWEDSEEARELWWRYQNMRSDRWGFENAFPQDSGKKVEQAGAWIMVLSPPHCEYTVPPFSIWFAVPWPFDAWGGVARVRRGRKRKNQDEIDAGMAIQPKRVKVTTPMGDLGIYPHEYSLVKDVREYLGREKEGVFLRQMNDNPVVDREALFYLQSRGIKRQDALVALISQIKDPTYLWIEMAPHYGEYFGKDWPHPSFCPFATPRPEWDAKLAA